MMKKALTLATVMFVGALPWVVVYPDRPDLNVFAGVGGMVALFVFLGRLSYEGVP
jgi:hypothetical protein